MDTPALGASATPGRTDASAEASPPGSLPTASVTALLPAARFDAACGSGHLTEAGRARVGRRPYIQNVSATSAAILFTTREPMSAATVHLTLPAGAALDVASESDAADASGHQRRVLLSGLEPDTLYCYRVEDWMEPVGFRTAPRSAEETELRFIAFGDSGGDSREFVRKAMDGVPFDLMLHVGDIAYTRGTLAEFEAKFFDTYADLIARFPMFAVSGNHEYVTDDAAAYRQVFELPENGGPDGIERWFSFDWANVHFIALDTERVGEEQAAWLEQDLSRNALPWKIVYMHRPPYSSGWHGSSLDVRDTFSPLFERFGVQLVLSGHDHDYERTSPIAGVTYIVTGGGGFSARDVGYSDFTVRSSPSFHFMQGEVHGDTLALRAIDLGGGVLDAVEIARSGAHD